MSLYLRTDNPARTPAEAAHPTLEAENLHLRMRVAVLSEALRAAEEELNACRFGECAWAKAQPPVLPYALAVLEADKREFSS